MTREHPSEDDIRRRFEEITGALSTTELQAFVGSFLTEAGSGLQRPEPVERRRPPLEDMAVLTVRVDLQHASPPIWRRLELRSDLTLAALHRILQVAFDWQDYHLFRFALGGNPFDRHAQLFLCPFDVEQGEEAGLPVAEVRIDEALQEPGDRLEYVYDYGDDWHLVLQVEGVRPASDDTPGVVAVGGRRAAPPEDCGGLTTADELSAVLPDPAAFDLDALNQALAAEQRGVAAAGLHPALENVLARLGGAPAARDLSRRLIDVAYAPETPEEEDLAAALHAVLWFLERAADGGLALTQAGYLRPDLVVAASAVVPGQQTWYGKNNRENLAVHLLAFREALQKLKLLRKYKGALLPTRRAAAAGIDPRAVWQLLVEGLIPPAPGFERDAAALLLLHVASTRPGDEVSFDRVADELTQAGWRAGDEPVSFGHVRDLPATALLWNLTAQQEGEKFSTFSRVARDLATTVLAPPPDDED
ncbi:plasmid pRiA4b ORF-3 family protein [Brachybacterium sp. UNK5269]|uniref:plasmid pRiA4b ORF-3 family protein n=1 Tax=Brachybacterium sp. UNK5269 TaxID=3408576 RepID=UPI003BB08B55